MTSRPNLLINGSDICCPGKHCSEWRYSTNNNTPYDCDYGLITAPSYLSCTHRGSILNPLQLTLQKELHWRALSPIVASIYHILSLSGLWHMNLVFQETSHQE